MARLLQFLLLTSLLLVADCRKRDKNAAHSHQGILKPYKPGPFENLHLGKKDEQHLLSGKPVMKQVMPDKDSEDTSGTAICIQDVNAPKPAVWNQILDLDAYKGKVPKVKECHNYVVRKNPDGTHSIKTTMKLGIMPGYSYTNHYDHTYVPEEDSVVWSLDYEKYSDFDDVAGHWHLEDHPSKPGCTRVFYACDIKTRGSVPGPVLNFISKSALKQATSWVKKESEAAPDAHIPGQFASDKSKVMDKELQGVGSRGGASFVNRGFASRFGQKWR
jgi:hypothetical protein